jgi:arylsulfatase A
MRVPLIIRWPSGIRAGQRESTPTISTDLVPTWLAAAGVDASAATLDGQNLLPLLTAGQRPPSRPVFFHHPHYTHAAGPFSSVIHNDWKLIRFYNDASGAEQLFDMAADPYEQEDLIAARPDRADALRAMLDDWLVSVDAELPRPNDAFDPAAPADRDRRFTWELALSQREELARKWRASLDR